MYFKADTVQMVPGTISPKPKLSIQWSDDHHTYLQLGYTQPNQSLISPGTDIQTSCTSFRASFPATRIKLLSTSSFAQHSPQSLGSQCSSPAAISSAAQKGVHLTPSKIVYAFQQDPCYASSL